MRFQSRLSVQCMQTKQEAGLSMGSVKEVDLYRRGFESTDCVEALRFLGIFTLTEYNLQTYDF